ncbi:V-type proton ATPase subunit F [Brachionus plicatilis]|uniref:V-type proton ATPase subunit F n=1 Tax=Brachionus plicatilis TaxID=10195 RepID=A0A3M7S7E1_BRAPC|nr:V-type proton ATPase subunit F [Brachionus plicatilis]
MSNIKGKLIAVIGDEDTVIGFLMSGSGELNKSRQPNYFIYDKNTSLAELEEAIRGFINRDDIAVLLIVQYVADMVRHVIDNHAKITPAILEIPSKEHAYDPSKDFILKRAQRMFSADDFK